MQNLRTDLALESYEMCLASGKVEGVIYSEEEEDDIAITKVEVKDEKGKSRLGRDIGRYITYNISKKDLSDSGQKSQVAHLLCSALKDFYPYTKDKTILVCGLGNDNITPDALGPMVYSKLIVTRHIKILDESAFSEQNFGDMCAVMPGVLGQTGIESAQIIKSVCEIAKPDICIVLDALASRKISRLACTIQISDTDITPGGGIGNKREVIGKNYLGVPVITIGVPTVVDAATLAADIIAQMTNKDEAETEEINAIKEVLSPYEKTLLVTPNNIDKIIENIASAIALAINKYVHDLSDEDILSLSV